METDIVKKYISKIENKNIKNVILIVVALVLIWLVFREQLNKPF